MATGNSRLAVLLLAVVRMSHERQHVEKTGKKISTENVVKHARRGLGGAEIGMKRVARRGSERATRQQGREHFLCPVEDIFSGKVLMSRGIHSYVLG